MSEKILVIRTNGTSAEKETTGWTPNLRGVNINGIVITSDGSILQLADPFSFIRIPFLVVSLPGAASAAAGGFIGDINGDGSFFGLSDEAQLNYLNLSTSVFVGTNWEFQDGVKSKGVIYAAHTVATFPATLYFEGVVTNALSPVQGAAVVAGGSAKCKVMYNGSAKIVTAVL